MARQGISTGIVPNDGTGDTLASGAVKINQNFTELYSFLGDGNNLNTIKADNISLTGITTGLNVPGISTLGFIQNTTLNVSGFSTLGSISGENLSVAGVTTGLSVPGISTLGFITTTTLNTSGVSTFSGGLNASEGADLTRLRVTGISTLGQTNLGQTNTTGFFNAGVSTLGNVNATTAVVSGFSTLGSISGGNLTLAGITTGLSVPGITTLRDTTIGNLSLAGITTGLSSPGISTLGSVSATTLVVTGVSTVGVVTGATSVQATNLYGDGSALTSLNASNLSSGTVPSARLSGLYDISITGSVTGDTISISTATITDNLVVGPIGSATSVYVKNGDINVANNLKVSGIATATTLRVNTLTNIAGTSIPNPISLTTAFVTLTSNITWHTNRNNTTQLLGSIAPYTNSKTKMVRISVIHYHYQPGGYHGYLTGWIFQTGKTYNVDGTFVENQHYNWYYNAFQTEVLIPWDPNGTQSISMFVTFAYNTSSLNYYNIVYTGRIDQ